MGEKTLLLHSKMLHDPKTVIGSDFDQETAEKIAPQFIARPELYTIQFYSKVLTSFKKNSIAVLSRSLLHFIFSMGPYMKNCVI